MTVKVLIYNKQILYQPVLKPKKEIFYIKSKLYQKVICCKRSMPPLFFLKYIAGAVKITGN